MKAIRIHRQGGPEVLEIVNAPDRSPRAHEVRVRHSAIGLNFIDIYQRSGLYPMEMPAFLGLEASGVVDAVGDGVSTLKPGDRVVYQGQPGAYAEANLIPEDQAVVLPEGISFETASAVFLKGLTADFLARIRPLEPGQWVWVHAAAGGVGSVLATWLASMGVRVIGAVGSAAKAKTARANGFEEVVIYGEDDIAARVRACTCGQGVVVVYDSVGKDTLDVSLKALARRGLLVSFGNASGAPRAVEPLELSRGGSLFLTRPTVFDYVATRGELETASSRLFAALKQGVIKANIGQTYPLTEVRAAHEALEGRRTVGATLLTL